MQGAKGWRAVLAVGDEDAEQDEAIAIFCPACGEREFDGPHR
jgi:YgiT-type zinc finger domain-containing protein